MRLPMGWCTVHKIWGLYLMMQQELMHWGGM
jgi:hypothetical protein